MQFNLKLSQKGWILILVMVVAEIAFGFGLVALLNQVETERREEERSKAIVSECADITNSLLNAAQATILWTVTHNAMSQQRYTECVAKIRTGVANLKQMTLDNKEKRKRSIKIARLSETVCTHVMAYGERGKDPNAGMINFVDFRGDMKIFYKPFFDELHALSDGEKERALNAPIAERQRQKKLQTYIIAGVAINVLIAWCVSLFFKSMNRRLRVLSSNAKLLARKEPLNNPLRGTDEIAELDGVFHEMAEALTSAEQRKQEFVSTICHDLRSPLANVQVSLALAAQGKYGELNQKGTERFAKAEQSIERLINLLNELLDAEKMEAGLLELDVEEIQLHEALEQSVEAVRTLAESSRVQLEMTPCDVRVIADQPRLIRVIVNLLSNAIKFSPQDSLVSVSAVKHNDYVEVRISDQGRGISEDDQKKIFDRFHRINDPKGPSGIGLGLTICKNVIEAHKGEIGVDSTLGKGSTFWFRLATVE